MVNQVTLIGRVGKQPEVKQANNKTVVNFTLATTESYKDKSGQKVENTTWHNIVIWDKLADIAAKYVNKGDQLFIQGKISNRSYEDKDGNKKYISEIVVSELKMLVGKTESKTEAEPTPIAQPANVYDDDLNLPF